MKRILLGSYLSFVFALLYFFCVWPAQALAVQYSRVVTLAARQAYVQANSTALSTYVAQRALSTTAGSLALRMVPGVGWAALGISAGSALYSYYYSQADLSALKSAAGTPGAWQVSTTNYGVQSFPGSGSGTQANPLFPTASIQFHATNVPLCAPDAEYFHDWAVGPFANLQSAPFFEGNVFINGPAVGGNSLYVCHRKGVGANPVQDSSSDATTQQQIVNYINTQNNYHTNHEAASQAPVGDNNVSIPVSTGELPSVVKDSSTVAPTDKVIAVGVPPPSGTQETTSTTQPTTTTTATTTNPNGSTTEQETSTANVSCIYGQHDSRTMQTVFDEHRAVWATSGLLALLATFQSLVWPTALPSFTLHSNFFGDLTLNFQDYASIFLALRTLIIATTTFIAVRYVFAGGGSNA